MGRCVRGWALLWLWAVRWPGLGPPMAVHVHMHIRMCICMCIGALARLGTALGSTYLLTYLLTNLLTYLLTISGALARLGTALGSAPTRGSAPSLPSHTRRCQPWRGALPTVLGGSTRTRRLPTAPPPTAARRAPTAASSTMGWISWASSQLCLPRLKRTLARSRGCGAMSPAGA